MPKTGMIAMESGIYKSDCCGVERAVPENHRFPPCNAGNPSCAGDSANWTLERKTQTKTQAK